MSPSSDVALDTWLATLAAAPPWDALLAVDEPERVRRGYGHTIREIAQQPLTWADSAAKVLARGAEIERHMRREDDRAVRSLVLTGSGSSQYAAECVAPILQSRLGVLARAVPASLFLTHPDTCVTTSDPPLVVSFARSGDSPESAAAVDLLLDRYPGCRHLFITCNPAGRLATAYTADNRVKTIVLDARTNDRSLVMTSSFTNMVVAGQALAAGRADQYREHVETAAGLAREILVRYAADIARVARTAPRIACYLGAGAQFGAAREAALKMLEMSGGAVSTIVDTPLGLRHGPMAALRDDTVVVAAVPAGARARGYTVDVLREIQRKHLAASRIVIGEAVPNDLLSGTDVAVELPGYDELGEAVAPVLTVVVGQILALFRCMAERLHPDAPSPGGIISRVVQQFPLYR